MDHGFMPIVVEVVSPEEFDAWLEEMGSTQSFLQTGDDESGLRTASNE
jgi:heme/copper-type cytochrome/quinol oxidase subunit 2